MAVPLQALEGVYQWARIDQLEPRKESESDKKTWVECALGQSGGRDGSSDGSSE